MKRRLRKLRPKDISNILTIVVCVVVLAAVAIGIWYFFGRKEPAVPKKMTSIASSQRFSKLKDGNDAINKMTLEEALAALEEKRKLEEQQANESGEEPLPGGVLVSEADKFFEGSVFIGDSVILGFRNYIADSEEEILCNPGFLASGSYAARLTRDPITEDSIHPMYKGEQRYIWDSLKLMEAKKVFLFFGINDLGMEDVDSTVSNYDATIKEIKNSVPGIKIYILSTTYMYQGSELTNLNNTNIRALNEALKEYCDKNNVDYVDIATATSDGEGYLNPEYSSDNYVHVNEAGYDKWIRTLREYAAECITDEKK